MAVILKISCGCGFNTEKIGIAIDHTLKTGHSQTILGEIRPDNPKPKSNKSSEH